MTEAQRILVVKLSSLGDLHHALPAVRMIRRGLGAQIDWAVTDTYVDLVACFEDVERVIPFPRRRFLRQSGAFLRELRAAEYDLVLDLQGLLKSAFVARLARAPRRIGPSFHREGSRVFYDAVAGPPDRGRHAADQVLDVVEYLGVERGAIEFPVRFPAWEGGETAPLVVLLPVSRWRTKNWPAAHYVALGRRLLSQGAAGSLVVAGGPAEREVCARIARDIGMGVRSVADELSLPRTGGLLAAADLLIANDSGPVHMAAAVGTPCLVLFGPTDPRRTGPYGDAHRVLHTDVPCRPCLNRRCRTGRHTCLRDLAPDRVFEAACEMLSPASALSS